jgi:hypothetical protein
MKRVKDMTLKYKRTPLLLPDVLFLGYVISLTSINSNLFPLNVELQV